MQRTELVPQEGKQIEINGELAKILIRGVSLEELDMALEKFSQQGQFAFGSFWGREESDTGQEKFDTVLHYHFTETIKQIS